MEYKSFTQLIQAVQTKKKVKKVAVVCADDEHTIEAVFKAQKDGLVNPVLIGDVSSIKNVLTKLSLDIDDAFLVHAETDIEAAQKAVALVHEGTVDFIMKGKLQTGDLLKAVVHKENGLRTENVMSHMAIIEVATYHKLIGVTDGGMMTYPDLVEKRQIIENAVNTFRQMGYDKPKVAAITAIEKVNPKMPETVEADALKQMSLDGHLSHCILEGPISYDLIMSKESAEIKGFESPVTGDVDIILVPDIHSGNILSKALIYSAGAKMAGFIIGAKCPIVLTSRGATTEEKYLSLALCASIENNIKGQGEES